MAVKKKSAAKKKKSAAKKAARKPAAAPKKKKKKKKKSRKASRRTGSGAGGWGILVLMVVVLAGVFFGLKKFQSAPEVPVVVKAATSMGSAGKAPGQLQSPRGISVGPDGSIAVADLGNSRVNVYNPSGTFKFSFGHPGEEGVANLGGEFREPSGVAIGPDGGFYVADAWNGRIQSFDPKGRFLAEYRGAPYNFYSPRNVAVDRNGNIYVADTGNSQVKIFSAASPKPIAFGGAGKGDGQFQEVFGLAINSKGEIFAADPGNKRVHKFTPLPNPRFVKAVKIPGWKSGSPFWPHLAVDAQDRVYVGDNHNNKIWMYDSQLEYLATLGGKEGQSPFGNPLGLAVDASGQLLVADMNGNRVVVLGPVRLPAKP